MVKKCTIEKVLEWFYDYPTKEIHIRGLAKELSLSHPTIIRVAENLSKEKLILLKKDLIGVKLSANVENPLFISKKRSKNLENIYELTDFLKKEYKNPKAIVLYGSYSRGEDRETSDIDITIITDTKKKLNLAKFEKKLKRDIVIKEFKDLTDEFKMTLANGIVLSGYLEI